VQRKQQKIMEKLRGASPRECASLIKKLFKLKKKGESSK
jgi:hypothetical protein